MVKHPRKYLINYAVTLTGVSTGGDMVNPAGSMVKLRLMVSPFLKYISGVVTLLVPTLQRFAF